MSPTPVTDQQIGGPVDQHTDGGGGGPGALGEHLASDHPGDGSRAHCIPIRFQHIFKDFF